MKNQDENLRNACHAAFEFFQKQGDPNYANVQSKLEYVVGSFDYDKNPVGLFEIGAVALKDLKEIKKKSPRKVAKKLMDDLEKYLEK